jgi:phosphatidylserine/phosphatidylglycerophosphate/cardiolipin synthase-like enzyme
MLLLKKLGFAAGLCFGFAAPALAVGATYQICLASSANCDRMIAAAIDGAKDQVLFGARGAVSAPVAAALVAAKHRGVDVRAIVPSSEAGRRSGIDALVKGGIPVLLDAPSAASANRAVVVDGKHIATGAFDFMRAAGKGDAENLLIMHDAPALAAAYAKRWHAREAGSTPYPGLVRARAEGVAPAGALRLSDR